MTFRVGGLLTKDAENIVYLIAKLLMPIVVQHGISHYFSLLVKLV